MAKHLFAQKIANLEGFKGISIVKPYHELTVSNVDARLVNLEKQCNVLSPPPMLDATWESLEYRAKRLERFQPPARTLDIPSQQQAGETSEGSDIKPETLRRVLIRLDTRTLTEPIGGDAEKDDNLKKNGGSQEALFDFDEASQHLCYAAGKHSWSVSDPIRDVAQLYAAAIELLVKVEGSPPLRQPPPGVRVPPLPPHVRSERCVGTCMCLCHPRPGGLPPPPPRLIEFTRRKSSKKRRAAKRAVGGFFKFGWLKNMFTRKKPVVDSDSDSDSDDGSGSDTSTLSV